MRNRVMPDSAVITVNIPGEKPIRELRERIFPEQGTREEWADAIIREVDEKNAKAKSDPYLTGWTYSVQFHMAPFDYVVERTYLEPGDRVLVILPHSEVNMHMGIAGEIGEIELLPNRYSAQIYINGQPYSSPVTSGEAGVLQDDVGQYAYVLYPA